jgi:hypothetical protein
MSNGVNMINILLISQMTYAIIQTKILMILIKIYIIYKIIRIITIIFLTPFNISNTGLFNLQKEDNLYKFHHLVYFSYLNYLVLILYLIQGL